MRAPEARDEEDDDAAQGGYFRGHFKAAVKTLLNDLFAATVDDIMDPEVLGNHVKDDGIHRRDTTYFHRDRGG